MVMIHFQASYKGMPSVDLKITQDLKSCEIIYSLHLVLREAPMSMSNTEKYSGMGLDYARRMLCNVNKYESKVFTVASD